MRYGLLLALAMMLAPCVTAQVPQSALSVASPIIKTPALLLRTGDSLFVRFSVRTDSVIRVIGQTTAVARSCGRSYFFMRVWKRAGKDSVVLLADSVEVLSKLASTGVPSDTTMDPKLAIICLP